MEGKKTIVWTLIISSVVIIGIITTPIWIDNMGWGLSISIVGTIISTTALVIAVIQINGLKETNTAIRDAVEENSTAIQRITNVYDIARHAQMINEIHGMINAKKWEIAHLRLLELFSLLGSIKNNIEKYGVELYEIKKHIDNVSDDLKILNKAIHYNSEIQPVNILNHLDDISPLLIQICTRLKTNDNDKQSA